MGGHLRIRELFRFEWNVPRTILLSNVSWGEIETKELMIIELLLTPTWLWKEVLLLISGDATIRSA